MYNPNLHFHFTGIGGSGMSGIAEILLNLGFKVSGSDLKHSAGCDRLRKLGAAITIGHAAENVPPGSSLVVYSSAVSPGNPEILEARRRGLPVIPRAEVLAELMRLKYGIAVAGSHGKTTTTSMIATVLEVGGLDPTAVIGGQVKNFGTGGKLGKGSYLVAESDESDRSFLLLKPSIAIVTNIDAEHMNAYASLADLERSFQSFIDAVPFYGLAVLCVDDPRVRGLAESYKGRKVTYGLSPDAQIRAEDIELGRQFSRFDVLRGGEKLFRIELPIPGKHMLVNSLAAISVGLELNIAHEKIAAALSSFAGVERRLEIIGEAQGIVLMNDYGHHPTEVRATLSAIRSGWGDACGKIHVVFQPHRYSRTRDCFVEFIDAFKDCDNLVVTEIYSAGEEQLTGISGEILANAINHPSRRFVEKLDEAIPLVLDRAQQGDLVLCMGAGSIGQLPFRILELLKGPAAACGA